MGEQRRRCGAVRTTAAITVCAAAITPVASSGAEPASPSAGRSLGLAACTLTPSNGAQLVTGYREGRFTSRVVTKHGRWLPRRPIASENGSMNSTAAAGDGRFAIAWAAPLSEDDDPKLGVYARRYRPGNGWTRTHLVARTNATRLGSHTLEALDVATSRSGRTVVAWDVSADGADAVHSAVWDGRWRTKHTIRSDTDGVDNLEVGVDARGRSWLGVTRFVDINLNNHLAVFRLPPSGRTWSRTARLTDGSTRTLGAYLDVGGDGTLAMTWTESNRFADQPARVHVWTKRPGRHGFESSWRTPSRNWWTATTGTAGPQAQLWPGRRGPRSTAVAAWDHSGGYHAGSRVTQYGPRGAARPRTLFDRDHTRRYDWYTRTELSVAGKRRAWVTTMPSRMGHGDISNRPVRLFAAVRTDHGLKVRRYGHIDEVDEADGGMDLAATPSGAARLVWTEQGQDTCRTAVVHR